jgi:D-alanyl-lipoteichoic acid acyltransferase DltB (MBOAT superfamily)
MIFSSWQFIFLFLPLTFFVYFFLNRRRLIVAGKAWLVGTSLFFYAYWDVRYLPLILCSILLNFAIGTGLSQAHHAPPKEGGRVRHANRKVVLATGITANLLLLGYYKYTDFFLSNLNTLAGTNFPLPQIVLPLAISFFTFTQIVYLVDSYRGETAEYDLLNYSLFVTFFPHLIAGPIVHHQQIMPQFNSRWTLLERYPNILRGFVFFSLGLFKKVVLADTFAVWANGGFDATGTLSFFPAWITSLSYSLQLYFDFSGYCDMAIGASLLFNIWLPINFDSPYKSLNIQDFWRRWHITLSSFLRNYLYIPLGGNRHGELRTYLNLFLTFVLGGLWHGATWMFVIWGAMHGAALVIHRIWKSSGVTLPRSVAWILTFLFVNTAWVFFRAHELDDALRVFRGMIDLSTLYPESGVIIPTAHLAWGGWLSDILMRFIPTTVIGELPKLIALSLGFFILSQKNSTTLATGKITGRMVWFSVILFIIAVYFMMAATTSVFLYFNF